MELRHLRYVVAVAEHGSVSRAARALHVSQSAVSEQLADLEREIEVSLFDRAFRSIRLTPHGELFLIEAKKTLSTAAHAVKVAQGSQRGELGEVRVGFFAGGVGAGFPQVIKALRKKHPGIRVVLEEMTPTTQWQALLDGRIDIGFTRRLESPWSEDLEAETVWHDPLSAVLPREHPLAPGPVDIADLAKESFVVLERETSPALFDKVIELCSEAGFSPRIAAVATVWSSAVLLVEAGVGISILPRLNLKQDREHDLAFCPLTAQNASVELVMAWQKVRETPVLDSLRSLVRESAREV